MSEAPSCQTLSDRKLSFGKLVTIWTTSLLGASFLVTLFTPEFAEIFHLVSGSLSKMEGTIIFFFVPPIVTIWGIGIVISIYKYRMLCAARARSHHFCFHHCSVFHFRHFSLLEP